MLSASRIRSVKWQHDELMAWKVKESGRGEIEVPSRKLPVGIEENHDKPYSGQQAVP
jgi:hypothetical protein